MDKGPPRITRVACSGNRIALKSRDKVTILYMAARLGEVCILTDLKFSAWERFWQDLRINKLWRSGAYKTTSAYERYTHSGKRDAPVEPLTRDEFAQWYRTFEIGKKKNTVLILKRNNQKWPAIASAFKPYRGKVINDNDISDIIRRIGYPASVA